MKKHDQKGAALIVVLSLLSISLMVGLSSMQSSQIDERLAGNYKAAAEAQMAAEFGAAYGFRKLHGQSEYFNSYDYDESCDKFSKEGLSEQERRSGDDDFEWYEVKPNAEIIGCQDESEPLYLSWGKVRDGSGAIIAESFIIFGNDSGGSGIKNPFEFLGKGFDYAILSGGPYTMNPASSVVGETKMNAGVIEVPDPREEHPSDPSRTGYVGQVEEALRAGSSEVVESCNSSFSRGSSSIVFCSGIFEGDIDDRLDGMVVVAKEGVENAKVKGDVSVSVVSGKNISFQGFGNNRIEGLVWAAGSISFGGRSNIDGSVVSSGEISFNGRTKVVWEGPQGDKRWEDL